MRNYIMKCNLDISKYILFLILQNYVKVKSKIYKTKINENRIEDLEIKKQLFTQANRYLDMITILIFQFYIKKIMITIANQNRFFKIQNF